MCVYEHSAERKLVEECEREMERRERTRERGNEEEGERGIEGPC